MIEATDGKICTQLCNEVQEKECDGLKTLPKGKDAGCCMMKWDKGV